MTRFVVAAAMFLFFPAAANAAGLACIASATPVDFGTFIGSAVAATGTISMTCTGNGNVQFTVALSTGSGSYVRRTLLHGQDVLVYNLYQDAARTLIWGDGTGGSTIFSGSFNEQGQGSETLNMTVYATLPGEVTAPAAGVYQDSIVVTISY